MPSAQHKKSFAWLFFSLQPQKDLKTQQKTERIHKFTQAQSKQHEDQQPGKSFCETFV